MRQRKSHVRHSWVKHFQTHHDCGVDVCTCRTSQLVSLIVKLFLRIFTQFQNRLVAAPARLTRFFAKHLVF